LAHSREGRGVNIDDYALKLLHEGAQSYAEDDIDESGELDNEDDLPLAIKQAISMAHAIRDNPASFRVWVESVST
jgi:hypothetical protein